MTEPLDIRHAAIDHHDRLSATFDGYYRDMRRSRFASEFTYGRYKVDQVIDALLQTRSPGAEILDVGCGTGEYLRRIAARGLKATGVEPAPSMLELAARNAPEARTISGVATELPFGNAAFDVVLEIEVLRYLHSDDIARALAEARRVLRPGGALLVTLVNRWALDGFYVRQRVRQRSKGNAFDTRNPHCEFFTPHEAERALSAAGFCDIRIEGRLFAPFRPLWKILPGLARRLAERLERLDDYIHSWRWTRRFAGHLIAVGYVRQ